MIAVLAWRVDDVPASHVVVAELDVPEIEGLASVEAVEAVVRDDEGAHALMCEPERYGRVAARAREHVTHDERP